MKKVLFVAAVAVLGLSSCKKDYTCSCTSASAPAFSKNFPYSKTTKANAKEACDTQETTYKAYASDVSCEVK